MGSFVISIAASAGVRDTWSYDAVRGLGVRGLGLWEFRSLGVWGFSGLEVEGGYGSGTLSLG